MHPLNYLFLLISFSSFAQMPKDFSLKHSMKQDGLSMNFTVLDSDKRGVKNHDENKTYYWYKAQKVMGTQGGSSGQLLDGDFECFYTNKQLCSKGKYRKGLKTGEWSYWTANGVLSQKEFWKNGLRRGKQYSYNSDGELVKTTIIKRNSSQTKSADSLVKIYRNKQTIIVYDSLGKKVSETNYRNGVLHGKQETIGGDGESVSGTYKNGELKIKEEKSKDEDKATSTEEKKPSVFSKMKERLSKKKSQDGEPQKPAKEPRVKKKKPEEDPQQPEAPQKEKRTSKSRKKPQE